ncbi:MAG: AAA family ATPase [Proteobacteria bacterium]|nr:AAA family ATPase [Pseudomonadota bacterium]MBU1741744.1 AAA family ATPase [Pseudomonadota bacterium]
MSGGRDIDPTEARRLAPMVEARVEAERREQLDLPLAPLTPAETGVAQRLTTEPPPREYIIEDLLPARIVGALIAMGGLGKSYFLLLLAFALALGAKVFGRTISRPRKVLYLGGEDSAAEVWRRLYAVCQARFDSPPPHAGRKSFRGVSVRLAHAPGQRRARWTGADALVFVASRDDSRPPRT